VQLTLLSHILQNVNQDGRGKRGLGMKDVAIVGAGLAGLVCAQRLRQHGYGVVVVEKSRGLGGRLATRRLPEAWADHGVRGLEDQGELTRSLIQMLSRKELLRSWQGKYASPTGITAVAKFLGTNLEILRGQRVERLTYADQVWSLALDSDHPPVTAKAIVIAIPAPQALMLLEPLDLPFLPKLRSVTFDPCITTIATFPPPAIDAPWTAYPNEGAIDWISLENTKIADAPYSVLVVQSSAGFAEQYLEAADLQPVGRQLLDRAAAFLPALGQPDILQVHRWRYAFARQPLSELYLQADSLVCAGDWCGGDRVEDALRSGWVAAGAIGGLADALPEVAFDQLLLHL
jgi:renalase